MILPEAMPVTCAERYLLVPVEFDLEYIEAQYGMPAGRKKVWTGSDGRICVRMPVLYPVAI
jgi:hypothetical protein